MKRGGISMRRIFYYQGYPVYFKHFLDSCALLLPHLPTFIFQLATDEAKVAGGECSCDLHIDCAVYSVHCEINYGAYSMSITLQGIVQ